MKWLAGGTAELVAGPVLVFVLLMTIIGGASACARTVRANGPNSHRRNTTLNTAAVRLGQLIAATGLTATDIGDSLLRAALDVGRPEPEARATIRSGLRPGQTPPARTSAARYRPHRATRDPASAVRHRLTTHRFSTPR